MKLTNKLDNAFKNIPLPSLKMLQTNRVKEGNFDVGRKSHLDWKWVASLVLGKALNIALLAALRDHCENNKFGEQNEKIIGVWTSHSDCSTIDFVAYIGSLKRFDEAIRNELEKVQNLILHDKYKREESLKNDEQIPIEFDKHENNLQAVGHLKAFIESINHIIRFLANKANIKGTSPAVVWVDSIDRPLPTRWVHTKCNVPVPSIH